MFATVGALDERVPDLLRGAWDDVHRQGPAAVSKICNCIVEVLDRILRAAAPDTDVRRWFEQAKRPPNEWDASRTRPTRTLRIRYILHTRPVAGNVGQANIDALIALNKTVMADAQSAKHADTATVARARSLLVAAEALLSMLLCN